MDTYIADHALIDGAIASDVAIDVDDAGYLAAVTPEAAPGARQRLRGLVVPGMVNLHSHGFQRAMAGLAERRESDGDSFWSWREAMYRLVARLSPEQVAAVTAQAYVEMLRAGYTHVAEFHYLHNGADGSAYANPHELSERVLEARELAGPGLTLLPSLYRFGGFGGAAPAEGQRRFLVSPESWANRCRDLHSRFAGTTVQVGAALHSLRAVALDDVRAAPALADTLGPEAPLHIHVAEQTKEVSACRDVHGTTPLSLLLETAAAASRWCLIHATHRHGDETRRLADSGAVVGLCPTTEANLGDGFFDLPAYAAAGGAWGIGTDSQVALDPRAELSLLEYEQRLHQQARNVMASAAQPATGRALYEAALAGGAQAAGAPVGRLAPGKRADLVVLDTDHPSLVPAGPERSVEAWLFTQHGALVRDVAVAGNWLVQDGTHIREAAIAHRFRQAVAQLQM